MIGFSYADEKYFDLFFRPMTASSERGQGDGLDSVQEDGPPVEPHGFEDPVSRPSPEGDVEDLLCNVDKPGVTQHAG